MLRCVVLGHVKSTWERVQKVFAVAHPNHHSQFWLAFDIFDLIHTSPNTFQANFDNITVLKPQWRFPARAYALWSNKKSAICKDQGGTSTYVPVKIRSPGRRVVP